MKKLEIFFRSKRNAISIIRNAGITFAIMALLMACPAPNDEGNTTNQDSIDSAKIIEKGVTDTIAKQDTTKKVDAITKKP